MQVILHMREDVDVEARVHVGENVYIPREVCDGAAAAAEERAGEEAGDGLEAAAWLPV